MLDPNIQYVICNRRWSCILISGSNGISAIHPSCRWMEISTKQNTIFSIYLASTPVCKSHIDTEFTGSSYLVSTMSTRHCIVHCRHICQLSTMSTFKSCKSFCAIFICMQDWHSWATSVSQNTADNLYQSSTKDTTQERNQV